MRQISNGLKLLGLPIVLLLSSVAMADVTVDEVYRLRLFFGLSLPEGGGVSLKQWQAFEQQEIPKYFDGFNVVDSVGYYKGVPERSKVVTVVVTQVEVIKAKQLAKVYAKRFKQESVMMVKVPVLEWDFISAD